MAEDGEVTNNEAEGRFELVRDGQTAYAQYEIDGSAVRFTHTIVPTELEGQGIGSRLVKSALDDARSRGLKVIPVCYFVRGYIERHPEYEDLLAPRS